MKKGTKINGIYFCIQFSGIIEQIEPNWEIGSRGAVNLLINLTSPISINGENRHKIFMQGINLTTGQPYQGSCPVEIFKNITENA
jgi:hypothetical protein